MSLTDPTFDMRLEVEKLLTRMDRVEAVLGLKPPVDDPPPPPPPKPVDVDARAEAVYLVWASIRAGSPQWPYLRPLEQQNWRDVAAAAVAFR